MNDTLTKAIAAKATVEIVVVAKAAKQLDAIVLAAKAVVERKAACPTLKLMLWLMAVGVPDVLLGGDLW